MAYQVESPTGFGLQTLLMHSEQSIYEDAEKAQHPLGSLLQTRDGVYVYCKASEALSAATIVTALNYRNHENTATVAAAAGATQITVTNGLSTTVAVDQYKDGKLIIFNGTTPTTVDNIRYIRSNTTALTTATMVVTLYDPLETAMTTADDITMLASPWLVQVANDQFEMPVCIPQLAVTSLYYFWGLRTGGGFVIFEDAMGADGAGERAIAMADTTPGYAQAQAAGQVIVGLVDTDAADTVAGEPGPIRACLM